MAELTAQQSVNTRDLPELARIKNGDAVNGGFSANSVLFTFGATEIRLISEANGSTGDFTDDGTTLTGGNVRAVEVRIGGDLGYTITGLEFPVTSLFADAGDGKLDTLPAQIFDGNEVLNGSAFADVLHAFGSDDIINGNDGDDKLDGGANHDELTGGLGADKLTGGADFDTFIFLAADRLDQARGRPRHHPGLRGRHHRPFRDRREEGQRQPGLHLHQEAGLPRGEGRASLQGEEGRRAAPGRHQRRRQGRLRGACRRT